MRLVLMDLADLSSVRRGAEQLLKELSSDASPGTQTGAQEQQQQQQVVEGGSGGSGSAVLHMLILNAGVVAAPMP